MLLREGASERGKLRVEVFVVRLGLVISGVGSITGAFSFYTLGVDDCSMDGIGDKKKKME